MCVFEQIFVYSDHQAVKELIKNRTENDKVRIHAANATYGNYDENLCNEIIKIYICLFRSPRSS